MVVRVVVVIVVVVVVGHDGVGDADRAAVGMIRVVVVCRKKSDSMT